METIRDLNMSGLPEDVQQNLQDIFEGKILPPLVSATASTTTSPG